jgi:hypothetical protein
VTLFDAAEEIGGQFNLAKRIPGKEEFAETLRYFRRRIEITGVSLRLGRLVDATDLAAFDHVVLATGIVPRTPAIPGIEHSSVASYVDVVTGRRKQLHRSVEVTLRQKEEEPEQEEHRQAVQDDVRQMRASGFSTVTRYGSSPDLWNTKPPLLIWVLAELMRDRKDGLPRLSARSGCKRLEKELQVTFKGGRVLPFETIHRHYKAFNTAMRCSNSGAEKAVADRLLEIGRERRELLGWDASAWLFVMDPEFLQSKGGKITN